MKDVNLLLSINEVNAVLRALSNLPYSQVHQLIDKIQQQARVQLEQGNGISTNAQNELSSN